MDKPKKQLNNAANEVLNNQSSKLPKVASLSSVIEKECFWENPSFLFSSMGILTMSAMLGTFFISQRYDEPTVVIISISLVAAITTLVGGLIIKTVDQLTAANRMKSEFVSIASHQLRTPLSIIKWYVEFLSKKEKQVGFSEEQKKYIKTIGDSNQRMIRLVNDLLDISRIETGKIQVHPEPTNIVELTENIIQGNKPLIEQKNIKLSFMTEPDIPLINIDPRRINIVIENLISNAIKYMKDNEPGRISIELSKENKAFLFNISDNGVGIPKKEQKNIFKKFFRADNTMKLKTSGTGLGLFIAKAIIESHKGKMWFVSKEGEGTTFYFNLPLKKNKLKI